ncbi:uncharacterized protein LOC143516460 [Brachyhypopomus gauderio]|uniref:uncharacterized protein LOC143516460 n=1 Tax=Brachyhypopomus gauderio TaxID=698409 RepID=UPI0040434672
MMRRCRLHKDDSQSTSKLLEGPLKEHVIFYQAYTDSTDLIIVIQTPSMWNNLEKYGKDIVFMDATYCVNQYDFPLLTLAIRDSHGHGIPVAYLILGNEKQATLELALEKLRPVFTVAPRCFMVDKDQRQINALRKVFHESDILLCWYHVTQAMMRWLSRGESGVSGADNAETRQGIMQFFTKLKSCSTKEEFNETSEMFLCQFAKFKEVCIYFQNNWEKIGHMWADFGRCYNHGDSDTNNLIERFFHRLKYQFLCGVRNRRLDNLIELLLGKTNTYFNIIQDLQAVGRVLNPLEAVQESTFKCANRMRENGWMGKINLIQTDTFIYHVPSETSLEVVYNVCPAEHYCSCVIGCRGRTCKHLLLINLLQKDDEEIFPNISTQLQVHANNLLKNCKYTILCQDNKQLIIEGLCRKGPFKPCITTNTCTCCSFSHYNKCACLLVAHELFGTALESVAIPQSQSPCLSATVDVNQRHSSSVRELKYILEVVCKWKKVPVHISNKIHELGVEVHRANNQNASSFIKSCSDDKTRKIFPIFQNRTKKKKASQCDKAENLKSFPMKKRQKLIRKCKRLKRIQN